MKLKTYFVIRVVRRGKCAECGKRRKCQWLSLSGLPLVLPCCRRCFKRVAGKVLRKMANWTKDRS